MSLNPDVTAEFMPVAPHWALSVDEPVQGLDPCLVPAGASFGGSSTEPGLVLWAPALPDPHRPVARPSLAFATNPLESSFDS